MGKKKEKKSVSEAAAVLGRVLRFCIQSCIIWEGFQRTWHRLEQVEKNAI